MFAIVKSPTLKSGDDRRGTLSRRTGHSVAAPFSANPRALGAAASRDIQAREVGKKARDVERSRI
jgi:hypothetical protein